MLSDPNIVLLWCALGVLAILAEIANPGFEIIGLAGVACLALGGYGLVMLGVNWRGLIPILGAFVFFYLQTRSPERWFWTVLAALSFMAGVLIMFNAPPSGSPPVSIPLVILVSAGMAALNTVFLRFALQTRDIPVAVGSQAMIGKVGEVRTELQPEGLVYVAGEEWSAVAEDTGALLEVGERVVVIAVDGVRLRVRPEGEKGS
jgi:membrane-bound serine protease (ClpP class)